MRIGSPMARAVVCVLMLIFGFGADEALAQQGNAVLRGTIKDATNAAVPGASVSISNELTGLNRRTITTTATGTYVFPALAPGLYRVTAEANGFKTSVRENVKLDVGKTQDLDIQLEVGGVSEQVVVEGENSLVETTSKQIGGNINQRELIELPSVNRNFIGFVGLIPGVVPNISTESFGSDSVSVNGQDPRYNNYLLDGANNNDDVIGQRAGAQARTALESVAEFQVLTNQFDAEFGRTSGAIINAITKSGSNDFHGSAFGFFQDNALNAKNRFDLLNQNPEPQTSMQQYGGTIGGPIKKDFANFFFSLERTQINEGVSINIPARPEFNRSTTEKTRVWNSLVRVDLQPGRNHQVSGRWLRESSPQFNQIINAFGRPVTAAASREESDVDQTSVGSWTWTISPTLISDMRGSFTRENVAFANPGFNAGMSMADLPPTLVFASFVEQQSDVAQARINNSYRLNETVSWLKGAHNTKVGFEYNYITADNNNEGDLNGVFFFPTDQDFDPANASTYPERLQIRVGGPQAFVIVNHYVGLFAQDTWKINRNLTLDLGFRYDKETIAPDNNNISPRLGLAWDPTGAGKTVVRGGYGFFYQLTPFEVINAFRTSGPFSSSFVQLFPASSVDPGPRAGQFPADPTLANGPTVDRALISSLVGTGTLLPNTSPFIDVKDRRNPVVRTVSAGIQHELVSNLAVTVDYIHQDGANQFVTVQLNPGTRATTSSSSAITRLFSNLGEVVQNSFVPLDTRHFASLPFQSVGAVNPRTRFNAGHTDYDALQFLLEKRMSRGFQFKASYTLANSRGDVAGSAFSDASFQLLQNLQLNLNDGPTDFDRRNNFVFSGLWEIPRTRGLTVSTVIRALSGTPFTILDSRVDANQNGINFDPLPAGEFSGMRTFPNGETLSFRFQNEGDRNGARAPGFFSADLRLAYKYGFREHATAGFTFELFNLTNRTNFNASDLSGNRNGGNNANFLVPTSAMPARTMQLGFRLTF